MADDIIKIVSTLGFPIAMCIGACVFIKYQFDTNNKNLEEMRKEHKEETTAMVKAIENNTLAITTLITKIDK